MEKSLWNPLQFLERVFSSGSPAPATFPSTETLPEGRRLAWDSDFFEADIFKIDYIPEQTQRLTPLLDQLLKEKKHSRTNLFAEVPSEAVSAFGVLGDAGFHLVETRLTYYHTLAQIPEPILAGRDAGAEDIPHLKATASGAVNAFDKYHADPFFHKEEADRYLETYIANCVQGFAEKVFVPDLPFPPAAFVALSRIPGPIPGETGPFFRIPLTACLPANKGWHYPLCLHALLYARSEGGKCLVMTTQSTNRAVIHNCEKLGFKLGSCFHLFSKSSS